MVMAKEQQEENEYERRRRETIDRNRARLQELGIPGLVASLGGQSNPKQARKPAKKRKEVVPETAKRKSRRVQGQDAAAEDDELGLFVINGDCPYCGKVLEQNHKAHLDRCKKSGRPRKDNLQEGQPEYESQDEADQEELQQIALDQEAEWLQRQDEKLQELQLNGLIDLDKEHARFVVLGSTNKHYKVELRDNKQSCECVDHRIRRHACKHIRLVLTQLGIADEPSKWHAAVESRLSNFE